MVINIKNLRLRTVIGINEWERKILQDVIINIALTFNGQKAAASDKIEDTLNYKKLTKMIISEVEKSDYYLLEKLADHILSLIMQDERVMKAVVEVDKPNALRFADSVSIRTESIRQSDNG